MPASVTICGARGTRIAVDSHAAVITSDETNQLTTKPGKLGHIIVWGAGSGNTLNVYDNAAGATSNQIWQWVSATGIGTFVLQLPIQNGIYVVTTGGTPGNFTVVYD